ncbi:arsenate reductase family protein [Clostridium chrysemydis]|uniref:arsenate reductase family protein n=1 Tax=Clostridium chrysemydis TaxID=2665504 RepID=UPI001883332C|nr:arsenate reductase family protein [Clostridium chrysemydis]
MSILFVEYPKCTTCRKAKKWLQEKGLEFIDRDIKEDNPSKEELKKWLEMSGLPIKKFFNTSGMLYREKGMKDKINTLSEEELLDILSEDGMMVKRPIVVNGDKVLVGFKEAAWEEDLLK